MASRPVCANTERAVHNRRSGEPRLTALAWLGMYNWAYLWLHVDGPLSAHNVAHRFAEIFLRGIAGPAPDSP